MKKLLTILFEVLFFVVAANAQRVSLVPTVEKTVAGNQYGALLMFQTKKLWSVGGFYQASLTRTGEGVQTSNPFYGISVNAPLVRAGKMNLYANGRFGVVNQNFLVIVPGLETEVRVSRWISVSALMSMRMSYPSAAARISIKL
jgi:N-acetylneuraminic acid mutarotase